MEDKRKPNWYRKQCLFRAIRDWLLPVFGDGGKEQGIPFEPKFCNPDTKEDTESLDVKITWDYNDRYGEEKSVIFLRLAGTTTLLDNEFCGRQRHTIALDLYRPEVRLKAINKLFFTYDLLVDHYRSKRCSLLDGLDGYEVVTTQLENSGTYGMDGRIGVGLETTIQIDETVKAC